MRPCSYTISMERNGTVCVDIDADGDTETGHAAATALVAVLAKPAYLDHGEAYRISLVG